jgi:hypothetical protein
MDKKNLVVGYNMPANKPLATLDDEDSEVIGLFGPNAHPPAKAGASFTTDTPGFHSNWFDGLPNKKHGHNGFIQLSVTKKLTPQTKYSLKICRLKVSKGAEKAPAQIYGCRPNCEDSHSSDSLKSASAKPDW